MFRPASRALLRAPAPSAVFRPAPRRLLSTSAEGKSRSWKNTAVRLGLAIGAVYYYNTSSVFAEHSLLSRKQSPQSTDASPAPTLDSVKPRIRDERAQSQPAGQHADAQQPQPQTEPQPSDPGAVNPADLEEEAGQEAAFNPETGEINWDCPCLGGMAHGPCGEEFKAAFSCFVYSQEEPKGMDCIDKFKGMQDCFRAHPEVYGSELDDEDDGAAPAADTGAGAPSAESPNSDDQVPATQLDAASHPGDKQSRAKEAKSQMNESTRAHPEQAESDQLLPKAWHDTEEKNTETKAARTEK